ncbi:hypothetical protein DO71_5725 [Burkholderia pseudomallei]|nr:hypothetical protein DO71_5725 [Burkholderia pseudomallei]
MQRTSSSSWASNVARVVMWRDPRAGGKRKVTVRDELAGDGAGRGRSRVRLRGRLRDGARMRRTPARQALQRGGRMPFASSQRFAQERRLPRMRRTPACQALKRWRTKCRSQVRSGSRRNGVCRVCGERRRDKRCSAGGRMPFASSQRFAQERRLPRMR